MLKTWFPASRVGEAVKTWMSPRSFLNAFFSCEVFAAQLQGVRFFRVFSEWIPPASSPPGHGGVPGAVAVGAGAGRLEPGAAPALVCAVLLITPSEAARLEETKEMKLIHGNVSLFSHFGGLPVASGPSHPAQAAAELRGWMGALGEPSLGKSGEEQGFWGRQAESKGC